MADTLPTLTKTIDNMFVETWYEIRPQATDNILLALVIWAALEKAGCFKTQVGSNVITRTIKYATPTDKVSGVDKGDLLPQGTTETETMAIWKWRYMATPVTRSIIEDQQNAGKFQIKNYVTKRLGEAREALQQVFETSLFRAFDSTEAVHKFPQSLNDIVPAYASRATGTYGGIARSNSWWQPKYKAWTAPPEVNMVSDMRNLFNTCTAGQSSPNLIITDQTYFEYYEDFGLDASQIVKGSLGLVDMGFKTLQFKGVDMIWTPNITASTMMMLNLNFVEVVRDPGLWMAMSEWKTSPLQMERIAHIMSCMNIITDQPRRHGLLY